MAPKVWSLLYPQSSFFQSCPLDLVLDELVERVPGSKRLVDLAEAGDAYTTTAEEIAFDGGMVFGGVERIGV